jgi:casein kinase 1
VATSASSCTSFIAYWLTRLTSFQVRVSGSAPTARVNQPKVKGDSGVARVLDDLANLRLEENDKVIGDRTQVVNAVQQAREVASKGVIDISSDEEENLSKKLPKARQLARLADKVSQASQNSALSKLVVEFVRVLEATYSRSLTIEGFSFLDALYKQLADPSVFVQPMRTSKRTGKENSHKENPMDTEDPAARRRTKMGKLQLLKGDVGRAQSNKSLAKCVKEFGAEIDKSKGKYLNKNAMEVLHCLGEKLQELETH